MAAIGVVPRGGAGGGPRRPYVADAVAGVARVRAAGHARPIVLAIWPLDTQNPFQALLTSRAEQAGIVSIGMDRTADLTDPEALAALAALRSDGVLVVLHLHWLARVLRGVTTKAEGRERIAAFLVSLDAFAAAGGRLVWTVHNILPHGTRWEALDQDLRREVVARADIVHVLSAGTVEAAAPWYEIPAAKVLHVPHPAYTGVYPDSASDVEARARYGFGPDDVVFGFVGNVRPYKVLDDLLVAFEAVAAAAPDGRRRRLLIAGKPADDPAIEAFLAQASALPEVVVDARSIPAAELSIPLRASDIVVLPYRASLNSGALLLALTFGRPVIAAASPHVTETVGPEAAITFEAGDRTALERALRDADRLLTSEARASALATAARFDPDALSRGFAAALRERLIPS